MGGKQNMKTEFQYLIGGKAISLSFSVDSCDHCLASVVPVWHYDDKEECLNVLQPFSIEFEGDPGSVNWSVPLSDACPIPPKVVTSTPVPGPTETPRRKSDVVAIAVGAGFFVGFSAFLVGFFWFNRRKTDNDDDTLSRSITGDSLIMG
jgi:hypothetical protein